MPVAREVSAMRKKAPWLGCRVDVAKRRSLVLHCPRVNRWYRSGMIREEIQAAQTASMKAGDKETLATVRLMMSAIKNRDIEMRTGKGPADDDTVIVEVLQKMVKQRRESIQMFTDGGRQELADKEAAEVGVIERFLPAQLSEAETLLAIEAIKAELSVTGLKDMGRVMAALKERHASQLDMSKASTLVKAALL